MLVRARRAVHSTAVIALLVLVALLGLQAGPDSEESSGRSDNLLVAGRKW